jgi:cholesterol transport system auxiliary component
MRLLLATATTLALTACTVFPDRPAHKIFQLPAPAMPASSAPAVDGTLRVSTPLAIAPVDSARILVKPDAHEIRAYEGARWSNRAPVLLGNHLVESFRQDGRLATVVEDTSGIRSDISLIGDLSRFQAEYVDGSPVVRLQLDLQLIDERTRETVSSKRFEIRHAAGDESVESVVEAFGRASDELARQVINWTVEAL